MNTNHIIEERSNEDGQSSSQMSPEVIKRHRRRTIILTHGSSKDSSPSGDKYS